MSRRADWIILAAALAVIAGAIVVGRFDLVPRGPICWSVIFFERECAGCGLTRSFAAMGRGDITAAFDLNPMGPLLFGSIALLAVLRIAKFAAPQFPYWFEADVAIAIFVAGTMLVRVATYYLI